MAHSGAVLIQNQVVGDQPDQQGSKVPGPERNDKSVIPFYHLNAMGHVNNILVLWILNVNDN